LADWTKHIERKEKDVREAKDWLVKNDNTVPASIQFMLMKGMVIMENEAETYKRWMKEDAGNS